jgi:hypothetical protein
MGRTPILLLRAWHLIKLTSEFFRRPGPDIPGFEVDADQAPSRSDVVPEEEYFCRFSTSFNPYSRPPGHPLGLKLNRGIDPKSLIKSFSRTFSMYFHVQRNMELFKKDFVAG